jgi:hypothetical protein
MQVNMRTFKMALVTLAASAVILLPSDGIAATTQSTHNAPLSSSSACMFVCFDLIEDGTVVAHDADLIAAATWCGLPSSVLPLLSIDQIAVCSNPHRAIRRTT